MGSTDARLPREAMGIRLARPFGWVAVLAVAVLVSARLLAAYHQPDATWLDAVGLTDGNDEDDFIALVWNESTVLAPAIALHVTSEPLRLVEAPAVRAPAAVAPPALVSRAPPTAPSA